MGRVGFEQFDREEFTGILRSDLSEALDPDRLSRFSHEVKSEEEGLIFAGRHRVVQISFLVGEIDLKIAIKAFGKQGKPKDRFDQKRGSKAARSFAAAKFLLEREVGTPEPLGYFERWEGAVLKESYYLSTYVEGLSSFKDKLVTIYQEQPECDQLMSLLTHVSAAIRKMHDAGFWHRDLGNQNIELEPVEEGEEWGKVHFIDLNRGRIQESLGMAERAQDFSRIRVPGMFLNFMVELYWGSLAPDLFQKKLASRRKNFRFWQMTRRWRHPFGKMKAGPGLKNLEMLDIWLWDRRTAQASMVLSRAERKATHGKGKYLHLAKAVLGAAPSVVREYRKVLPQAFSQPVPLAGKIGMSLEMADLDFEKQVAFLDELGPIPLLLRFCHHEGREQWEKSLLDMEVLHAKGHAIRVAVLQDRKAVLEPESWKEFLECILPKCAELTEGVEICHAVNRSKWGIHSPEEQAELLQPLVAICERFPELKITGPACIDFEYHFVIAALDKTPEGLHYDALSHHLYVDRRGAPENRQGKYSTVEKCALLKAIANTSPRCDERVIISEVNWPLEGAGIYSPVDATFRLPDAAEHPLHVSEETCGHFMLRYFTLTLCSGYIDQVYWWRLVSHGFGLIDEKGEGGWRARPGFEMLKYFLKTLGDAVFTEKMETEEGVYALRFEAPQGEVIMAWSNGKTAPVTWETGDASARDVFGNETTSDEVGDAPVYFFLSKA